MGLAIFRAGGIGREKHGLLPSVSRGEFVASVPAGDILEIGPFNCPQIRGPSVRYFDILNREQLRARAAALGLDPTDCPHIDYVSAVGDLTTIPDQFDVIFSSHVIEHQPDLIGHLCDVAELLRRGGAYFLVVPDKRYCFDHFKPITTVDDVLAARGRLAPSEEIVSRNRIRMAHNDARLHWLGWHGRPLDNHIGEAELLADLRRGEYVDVHHWAFTPSSFRDVINGVSKTTGLAVRTIYATRPFAIEFMVVLFNNLD